MSVTAQAFSRRLHDGSVALAMLNRRDRGSLTLTVTWAKLGVAASGPCKVRDLIAQHLDGAAASKLQAAVASVTALQVLNRQDVSALGLNIGGYRCIHT